MTDEQIIDREIRQIVVLMREDFPSAADWNLLDDGKFEILDGYDRRIGVITEDTLDGYYNRLGGINRA